MNSSAAKNTVPASTTRSFWYNILAVVTGGICAFLLIIVSQNGLFTADILNQYGRSVDSFSGAELVYDLTHTGTIEISTKRNFATTEAFVFTIHYDTGEIIFDTGNIVSPRHVATSTAPYTLTMMVMTSGAVSTDTTLLTIPYTATDPSLLWYKTVFMGMVDVGADSMEDLIVFTQTPSVASSSGSSMHTAGTTH